MTKKIALAALLLCIAKLSSAQYLDTFTTRSDIQDLKKFTYRIINVEYVKNPNDYMVEEQADTFYATFTVTKKSGDAIFANLNFENEFGVSAKEKPFFEPEKNETYELKFDTTGHLLSIENWVKFKNMYMKSLQSALKKFQINQDQYNNRAAYYNNRENVERDLLKEYFRFFGFYQNDYITNSQYIVATYIPNPLGADGFTVTGNQYAEKPYGSKNTYTIHAMFETGFKEEQQLIADYTRIAKEKSGPNADIEPLNTAKMTSEMALYYNKAQERFMNFKQSYVLLLNESKKVREIEFTFWDLEKAN